MFWHIAKRKLDLINRVRDLRELAVPPGNRSNGYAGIEADSIACESTINTVFVSHGKVAMRATSKSWITTKRSGRRGRAGFPTRLVARRLPLHRPPTRPGEMLLEEFIKPLGISQVELAARLGISFPRLNEVIRGRRAVTSDTALRLARVLGMSADFWLGLQLDWDLWHAMRGARASEIEQLEPLRSSA